jgi:hypothetical protein
MMLLEVLIAFVLIVLCALPLMYPHVYFLKSQKEFIRTIELDHLVSLMYGDVLQRLYLNDIPWSDIENKKEIPVDENLLQRIGYDKKFFFEGNFRFEIEKSKHTETRERWAFLLKLIFTFKPLGASSKKQDPLEYHYLLYMERHLKQLVESIDEDGQESQ